MQVTAATGRLVDLGPLSATVPLEAVQHLPLDGRNFLELSLLAAGTAPGAPGSASSVRGDFSFTANGAREDFNSYLLDGADNVDPKLNTVAVRPAVEAIRECKVSTNAYDAAFGRYAGAQVNVMTRAGTNAVSRDRTADRATCLVALIRRRRFAVEGKRVRGVERAVAKVAIAAGAY